MTIDEAIEHAKEVARTCDDGQCAADHIQLAEWLRRARGADKAARWYTEEIQELKAENTKLRYKVHVLEGGNKWLQILNDSLKANNARLRELCKSMRCALAGHEDKVYLAALDETLIDTGFDLQKLGIEVIDG